MTMRSPARRGRAPRRADGIRQRDDGGGCPCRRGWRRAVPARVARDRLRLRHARRPRPRGLRAARPRCVPHVEGLAAAGHPGHGHRPAAARGRRRPCPPTATAVAPAVAAGRALVIGGQSYGGRVASLLAAEDGRPTPGSSASATRSTGPVEPDWEARTAHWPSLQLPVLLLSGEADPFARVDLLCVGACAERLPERVLVTYPGVGTRPEARPDGRRSTRSRPSSASCSRAASPLAGAVARAPPSARHASPERGGTCSEEPTGMTRTIVRGARRRTSCANWWGGSMRVDGRIQRKPSRMERAPVDGHRVARPDGGHGAGRSEGVKVLAGLGRRAPAPDRQERQVEADVEVGHAGEEGRVPREVVAAASRATT